MFTFELTYHERPLEHKPTTIHYIEDDYEWTTEEFMEYGIQSYSKYHNEQVSIAEFYNLALRGHTWRMGHYDLSNQNMRKENVDYIQILSLDFDGVETTPEQMSVLAQSYGLLPNFWYYSFSQGKKSGNNFRLVWVLEKPLTQKEFEVAIVLFMEKFKGERPDISTKDASRLFYGTRHSGQLLLEEPLKMAAIGFINIVDKVAKGQDFRKAKLTKKDFCSEVDNLVIPDAATVGPKWFEELEGKCSIWDKWVAGEYISYDLRFLLWSNLKYIKRKDTTAGIVDDIMQFFNEEAYIGHTFSRDEISSTFKKATYAVPICDNNITVPDFFNGTIRKLNVEKVDLEIVEQIFNDELPLIMERPGMDYIEVQTAMGKTEQYINWALGKDLTQTKIIIAAPTYSLLYELKDRILRKNREIEDLVYLPPRSEEFSAEEMFNIIHGKSSGRELAGSRKDIIADLVGINYENETTYKKCGIYLVSHAVLSNLMVVNHTDYILIDENIEDTVIYNKTITTDNLLNIKSGMREENYGYVDELVNNFAALSVGGVLNAAPFEQIFKPRKVENKKVVEEGNFSFAKFKESQMGKSGCPGLYFMRTYKLVKTGLNELTIHGRKQILDNALNSKTKIKLFCATPQFTLMSQEYPNVRHNTFGLARNKGKIIQYTGITGAKGIKGTENVDKYMEFVAAKIGKSIMVITHKAACQLWEAAGFIVEKNDEGEYIHLGNNAGLDKFYGRDIAIVGKLELSEEEYKKQWAIYKGSEPLPKKSNRAEVMYGVQTKMRLFEDDFLKNLQLEHINKTVSQAAGRARALRAAGATVYVFGNFILKEADEIILT